MGAGEYKQLKNYHRKILKEEVEMDSENIQLQENRDVSDKACQVQVACIYSNTTRSPWSSRAGCD